MISDLSGPSGMSGAGLHEQRARYRGLLPAKEGIPTPWRRSLKEHDGLPVVADAVLAPASPDELSEFGVTGCGVPVFHAV
jgi:hypothetical protein